MDLYIVFNEIFSWPPHTQSHHISRGGVKILKKILLWNILLCMLCIDIALWTQLSSSANSSLLYWLTCGESLAHLWRNTTDPRSLQVPPCLSTCSIRKIQREEKTFCSAARLQARATLVGSKQHPVPLSYRLEAASKQHLKKANSPDGGRGKHLSVFKKMQLPVALKINHRNNQHLTFDV